MDTITSIGCMIAGLFGIMLSFYLALCFIGWMSDVIDKKSWRYWK